MVHQAEKEAVVPEVAERVRDLRGEVADPRVVDKAKRRRFGASYKLKILEEIDRHPYRSGAILRREGLYSSPLSAWRKQREEGAVLPQNLVRREMIAPMTAKASRPREFGPSPAFPQIRNVRARQGIVVSHAQRAQLKLTLDVRCGTYTLAQAAHRV